jgi:hypothetical protein
MMIPCNRLCLCEAHHIRWLKFGCREAQHKTQTLEVWKLPHITTTKRLKLAHRSRLPPSGNYGVKQIKI